MVAKKKTISAKQKDLPQVLQNLSNTIRSLEQFLKKALKIDLNRQQIDSLSEHTYSSIEITLVQIKSTLSRIGSSLRKATFSNKSSSAYLVANFALMGSGFVAIAAFLSTDEKIRSANSNAYISQLNEHTLKIANYTNTNMSKPELRMRISIVSSLFDMANTTDEYKRKYPVAADYAIILYKQLLRNMSIELNFRDQRQIFYVAQILNKDTYKNVSVDKEIRKRIIQKYILAIKRYYGLNPKKLLIIKSNAKCYYLTGADDKGLLLFRLAPEIYDFSKDLDGEKKTLLDLISKNQTSINLINNYFKNKCGDDISATSNY